MEQSDTKRRHVWVDDDLYQEMQEIKGVTGVAITEQVRQILSSHLNGWRERITPPLQGVLQKGDSNEN